MNLDSACPECGRLPPRHAFRCSGVLEFSREDILREMVRLDDQITVLRDQLEEYPNSHRIARDLFLAQNAFWEWPRWLGFNFWESTRAGRDAIRVELDVFRSQQTATGRRIA